ncbi:MAG TPA: DUF1684 domain-containing protein [Candidatus Solibacter sp.]|jgi:uncharacterized protein (DUF1684 family)|nr:DUF1684 domain-containing protein [Candidatus Solibacter sp.]
MSETSSPVDLLDLVDWRRRVGDLYRISGPDGLAEFRAARDELLRTHPQSPIQEGERASFPGIRYFTADPAYRVASRLEPSESEEEILIETGGPDGDIRYGRAGTLAFRIGDADCRLTVFSLIGYGGGLFLPFRDSTSGHQTYGGGRYLMDTIKGSDRLCLESRPGSDEVTIDFNYAYNPSCAYDPHWACPLAPRENWLPVPVEAGEMSYDPSEAA